MDDIGKQSVESVIKIINSYPLTDRQKEFLLLHVNCMIETMESDWRHKFYRLWDKISDWKKRKLNVYDYIPKGSNIKAFLKLMEFTRKSGEINNENVHNC